MRAILEFVYEEERKANKIARLLEIDNTVVPIKVKSKNLGNKVITEIEHESLKTLLTTLEDVLFCEWIIDKVLRAVENVGH